MYIIVPIMSRMLIFVYILSRRTILKYYIHKSSKPVNLQIFVYKYHYTRIIYAIVILYSRYLTSILYYFSLYNLRTYIYEFQ